MTTLGNANQSEIDSLRAKCGLNQVNEPSSCEAGAIDDLTLYLLMGKLFFLLGYKMLIIYLNIVGIYSGIISISILMIIFGVEDFEVEPLDENFR